MEPTLSEIIHWAKEAGRIIKDGYGKLHQVTNKSEIDLVTEIDKQSEDFLFAQILQKFPQHTIIGEESGIQNGHGGSSVWYIDPLDGTTNYVHGLPFFSVSIAYASQGQTRLGVVYDPILDECFAAERGKGAFLNGQPIQIAKTADLLRALLVTGFPYDVHDTRTNLAEFTNFILNAQAVRRLGSAALDLCYVACGRLDGYWEFNLNAWDVAAGVLIVEEAGGLAARPDGSAFRLQPKLSLVTANPLLLPKMVEILKKTGKE